MERNCNNVLRFSLHFFQLKINHFLDHTLNNKRLVLWGTGPKGKLTASILESSKIPFEWMDLHTGKIGNKEIKQFKAIESMESYTLLLSVYPPTPERLKLEQYLQSLNLKMGENYWYL